MLTSDEFVLDRHRQLVVVADRLLEPQMLDLDSLLCSALLCS